MRARLAQSPRTHQRVCLDRVVRSCKAAVRV